MGLLGMLALSAVRMIADTIRPFLATFILHFCQLFPRILMSIESLKDYVFTSKYSRYIPDKMRRETFEEAIDRVIDMHRRHFAAKGMEIEDLLQICETGMKNRLVLGSQRAMQFGGDPILRKHARIYNCTTSYCDRPRFF